MTVSERNVRRCSSRGSFFDRRHRCALEVGHSGWHRRTVFEEGDPDGVYHKIEVSWDGKSGFFVDEQHRFPDPFVGCSSRRR